MIIRDFRDLKIWQKAHELVLDVYRLTKDFPSEEKFGLVQQMRRAAVSICANIAEGGKKSTKDYLRYLDISFGSLQESRYYFLLSRDLDYIPKEKFEHLWNTSEDIAKMLNGLLRSLKHNAQSPKP